MNGTNFIVQTALCFIYFWWIICLPFRRKLYQKIYVSRFLFKSESLKSCHIRFRCLLLIRFRIRFFPIGLILRNKKENLGLTNSTLFEINLNSFFSSKNLKNSLKIFTQKLRYFMTRKKHKTTLNDIFATNLRFFFAELCR